jgi:hypothetical protein
MGNENGLGDDRIDEIDSDDDSDCSNEPGDYPTPQSLDEQANMGQNDDISSDLNQAAPSSTSSEPSQRRSRFGRALITPEEASQSR